MGCDHVSLFQRYRVTLSGDMSVETSLLGVKSHIPILKPGKKEEQRLEDNERRNRKWADKLKRRSASTLSLFNVTHKVPSHIVSPKSPVKDTLRCFEDNEMSASSPPLISTAPLFHRSNLELSNCWWGEASAPALPSLPGENAMSSRQCDNKRIYSKDQMHSSDQDLVSTWWHKKMVPFDPMNEPLYESNQKSVSITNIYDEQEDDFMINSPYFNSNKAPMSLPANHNIKEAYGSCQELPKVMSHELPPITGVNSGLKSQFRSEQNLFNSDNFPGFQSEMHSLDYNYGSKSMAKFNFDISTIKELPEDRSDSPVKQFRSDDSTMSPGITDFAVKPQMKRSSLADKYRSLQDLRQPYGADNQPPISLTTSQSNILFQTIPEDDVHDITTPFTSTEDRDCFRSIQDLRDVPSISSENLQYSLDYHLLNNYMSVQDLSRDSPSNKHRSTNNKFSEAFAEHDLSVSMIDIGHTSAESYQNLMKRPISKIPKRRHTLAEHDTSGLFPNIGKSHGKSVSSHNIYVPIETKQDEGGHDRSKSADKAATPSSKAGGGGGAERTASLDRKKGCLGCQHKRERKPVIRQHSMPHTKVLYHLRNYVSM